MKEFEPYFIYCGSAYPHKNLERAIKAFVMFHKNSHHEVDFYIVSKENKFTKKLSKLIKKLKAEKYIKLLGFVDDKKLIDLYRNSLGFIYPSLAEGFGLPGLEALKAGTILLASDIAVFKEIYGKYAVYFNPKSVESIAAKLEEVVHMDSKKANEMIKAGHEFVKRYSWEKMARETLAVYQSVR
jgi:glycosyltransferase involved in cell wall biosynthesis